MDLVVFIKVAKDRWQPISSMPTCEEFDYFLCLPKHKEACLHWLNGGLIECNSKLTNGWEVCAEYNECFWKFSCGMMREDASYRIKPKKEKRWIDEAQNATHGGNWQFIEIWVEV